jgi:DNA-binding beta-propeller fold protein YncE
MTTQVTGTAFRYEAQIDWHRLPPGMTLRETAGVAVNSKDQVYLLTRNTDNPVIVFDRDGRFLTTFGKGTFTERAHGIHIGPDDAVYCVDDGTHTVTKFSPEGELLLTIGTPGRPSPRWSGEPFCRPTHAVVSRRTGHIYVSDGYANARVHRYTPDGRHVRSWGTPGIDPGQFMIPHNIGIDAEDRVYVADREAHRVQVFDADGNLLAIWQNVHRPCGLAVGPDGNVYIGELGGVALVQDCPGYGHRVSVYSPEGRLLARFGAPEEGEAPGQFIAPHGIGVDSRGDVYVGEVSYTIRGRTLTPPRELRSFSKLRRLA